MRAAELPTHPAPPSASRRRGHGRRHPVAGTVPRRNGRPRCPAVAVLLGTPRVPRVRRPARHRGEHGRTHRDCLVGHVLCHCRRGGAPGTVREGPRRFGCGKVRPRVSCAASPWPPSDSSCSQHRSPLHPPLAASRAGRGGLPHPPRHPPHGPRRRSRLPAAPPRRPLLRPALRLSPIRNGGHSARSSNPARWRAARCASSNPRAREQR